MTPEDEPQQAPGDQQARKLIYETQASLFSAIDQVHQDLANHAEVRESTRRWLLQDLATYINLLRPYRDAEALKGEWEKATPFEQGPEAITEALFRGEEQEVLPDGHNPNPETKRVPVRIPAYQLYQSTQDVHDIAEKIGFAPEPKEDDEKIDPDPF